MQLLTDKKVLITGGTSGIGKAIAESFIQLGAKVVITGRRTEGGEIAGKMGATFIRCDVTIEEDVTRTYKSAVADSGLLDVIILNAGVAHDTEGLENTPTDIMREIIETNLMGVYYGLKHAPSYMENKGSIITTGSAAGSGITTFGAGEYAASKAGAAYLVRTAAIEFADRGIRVNSVCPASIAGTGMMAEDDGSPVAKLYASFTALNRMGSQDEAVGLYKFLASDESTFITGQEIRIDGGATAGISAHVGDMLAQKAGL